VKPNSPGPFLDVRAADGVRRVEFKQCIIAAGSESARLPGFADDPRVIDSTGALELPPDCKRLLVIAAASSDWKWPASTMRWVCV